jgi:DNA invertase Pin-like site-specific DNA recombinase
LDQDRPRALAYVLASPDCRVASPDDQLAACRRYCEREGLGEPAVYADPDTTLRTPPLPDRAAGRRLLRDLRRGDHVVTARLDRLCRTEVEFAFLADTWAKQGVTLHIGDLTMVLRPDDPASRAFVRTLVLFARGRGLVAQRCRESILRRQRLGLMANWKPPWGFKNALGDDGRWRTVEDPYESEICIRYARLTLAGYGDPQIAHAASG